MCSTMMTLFVMLYISGCRSCTPMEIERKIKGLRKDKFKMRQVRNFFVYLAVPLLTLFRKKTGRFFLDQTVRLMNGIRAIGGFSCQAVDTDKLGKARVEFKTFLRIMCEEKNYGIAYPTYKLHLVSSWFHEGLVKTFLKSIFVHFPDQACHRGCGVPRAALGCIVGVQVRKLPQAVQADHPRWSPGGTAALVSFFKLL